MCVGGGWEGHRLCAGEDIVRVHPHFECLAVTLFPHVCAHCAGLKTCLHLALACVHRFPFCGHIELSPAPSCVCTVHLTYLMLASVLVFTFGPGLFVCTEFRWPSMMSHIFTCSRLGLVFVRRCPTSTRRCQWHTPHHPPPPPTTLSCEREAHACHHMPQPAVACL